MNIDLQTYWAINAYSREESLRAAAAHRLAAQLPRRPSPLRIHVAHWLHSLANQLEPSVDPLRGMLPAR